MELSLIFPWANYVTPKYIAITNQMPVKKDRNYDNYDFMVRIHLSLEYEYVVYFREK